MKSFGQILKTNIPEYLQNKENLVAYLEAVGTFADGYKEAIEQFDFSRDYEYGTVVNLQQSLKSIGFDIPAELSSSIQRIILRDAIEMFLMKGTESAFLWVLNIIGLKPTFYTAWLPSPRDLRLGYLKDINDPSVRNRYHIDKFSFTELLYGDVVEVDGEFFFSGNKFNLLDQPPVILPILGRKYENIPDIDMAVGSTPYTIIKVENSDLNAVTEPYEVDGVQYFYSEDEVFLILNELISYFVTNTVRPSNVKNMVILYSDLFNGAVDDYTTVSEEVDKIRLLIDDTFVHDIPKENITFFLNGNHLRVQTIIQGEEITRQSIDIPITKYNKVQLLDAEENIILEENNFDVRRLTENISGEIVWEIE